MLNGSNCDRKSQLSGTLNPRGWETANENKQFEDTKTEYLIHTWSDKSINKIWHCHLCIEGHLKLDVEIILSVLCFPF